MNGELFAELGKGDSMNTKVRELGALNARDAATGCVFVHNDKRWVIVSGFEEPSVHTYCIDTGEKQEFGVYSLIASGYKRTDEKLSEKKLREYVDAYYSKTQIPRHVSDMVKEFHRIYDFPIAEIPTIPDFDRRLFYATNILDEAEELCISSDVYSPTVMEAFKQLKACLKKVPQNLGESASLEYMADANADIVYFVEGLNIACGINSQKIMEEVHRSNMSKVWPGGIVKKDENGKVMKYHGWSEPNLNPIIYGRPDE